MDKAELNELLRQVAAGEVSPEDAALELKMKPIQEVGEYAKIDMHRGIRQGVPEVVYGAGKTKEHVLGIANTMLQNGQKTVLITRIDCETADFLHKGLPADTVLDYNELAKTCVVGTLPEPNGAGKVVVATGGTSDIPVAEEAAITAEVLGNQVVRLYDVGVSIGGLADCPVIAVPTSVGYGASLGGIAALLSMLNSCASGVSVVNIDNGFGAGYMASMINHLK